MAAPKEYSFAEWEDSWEKNDIGFHSTDKNHLLVKHLKLMVAGRSHIKIFFPLCGKAVDMKWIYDLGHTVVGLECVEQAVREFFQEQGLTPVEEDLPSIKGKLFKTKDARIRIYCCDLFNFSSDIEGEFDGIFDRGSFGVFTKQTRPKYADLLVSLMSNGCKYLLNTFQFEKGSWIEEIPRHLHDYTQEEINKLFSDRNCFTEIVDLVALEEDRIFDRLHLITRKC